jgi:cell division protein FtsL
MVQIQNEINDLNKEVDEKNMALYEIKQQSLRTTNKESIFSKQYTPTVLREDEEMRRTRLGPKDLGMAKTKPYCSLI